MAINSRFPCLSLLSIEITGRSSYSPVWFFFFSCEESGCQAKGIRQGLHKGAEVMALVGNSLCLELLICEMGRDEASQGCFVVPIVHYVI